MNENKVNNSSEKNNNILVFVAIAIVLIIIVVLGIMLSKNKSKTNKPEQNATTTAASVQPGFNTGDPNAANNKTAADSATEEVIIATKKYAELLSITNETLPGGTTVICNGTACVSQDGTYTLEISTVPTSGIIAIDESYGTTTTQPLIFGNSSCEIIDHFNYICNE